jgi:hypothetical protein
VYRLVALSAAAVVASLALAPHASGATRCALPSRAKLVTESDTVVFYSVDRYDRFSDRGTTTFTACIRTTGERQVVQVDDESGCCGYDASSNFRLAGHYVGWSNSLVDHYGNQHQAVHAWDLRRRKIVRSGSAGGRDGSEYGPDTEVSALVLSSRGAIAWVTETYEYLRAGPYGEEPPGQPKPRRRLGSVDAFGQLWLDEGLGIEPDSLRIADGVAHWRKRGEPQSARLQDGTHCALGRRGSYEKRNRYGVVYRYDTGERHDRTRPWYACLFRSGRRTHLANTRRRVGVRAFKPRIHGRFAAIGVARTDEARDAQRVRVDVFDLRTGARKWSSTVGTNPGGDRTRFGVLSLVLARNGGIAYVAARTRAHRPAAGWELSVRARWPGGSGTVDIGPDIVWYTLQLDGLTASWLHGDEERSLDLS